MQWIDGIMQHFTSIYRKLSMYVKLYIILALSLLLSLLVAFLIILKYEKALIFPVFQQQLSAASEVLSFRLVAPLVFLDEKTALEDLLALKKMKNVSAAALYNHEGVLFVSYGDDLPALSEFPKHHQLIEKKGAFHFVKDLYKDNDFFGVLYVRMDMPSLEDRLPFHLATYFFISISLFILGFILFVLLRRSIIEPVIQLKEATKKIAENRDYSVRLPIQKFNELGQLSEKFNVMLCVIQDHARELLLNSQKLKEEKNFAHITLSSIQDCVVVLDIQFNITFLNSQVEKLTGFYEKNIMGCSFFDTFQLSYIEQQCTDEGDCMMMNILSIGHTSKAQYATIINSEKQKVLVEISAVSMKSDENVLLGLVVVFRESAEKLAWEKKITYQATHDRLTGLPNRLYFEDALRSLLNNQNEQAYFSIAVLFLDIDRFKQVNDSFGHAIGDLLLIKIAVRLKNIVRSADVVCRQGGDEFLILLTHMPENYVVKEIAASIIQHLGRPFFLNGNEILVGASVGIYLCQDPRENIATIIKNADIAMYHAKSLGKNNYQFYRPELYADVLRKNMIEATIKEALANDRLSLVYQPQFCLKEQRWVGIEVLLRCDTFISPVATGELIAIAEESSLILSLGEWVFRQACLQRKKWQESGVHMGVLSINISPIQLQQHSFLPMVKSILSEIALDPRLIAFELTETTLIQGAKYHISLLDDIKNLGVRIYLDDFGTGYSSLSYLKKLPIDVLKIDRSFIEDIEYNKSSYEIIKIIVQLAKQLNLKVIAEGVETLVQANMLYACGCYVMQGNYFSKPYPADRLWKSELVDKENISKETA